MPLKKINRLKDYIIALLDTHKYRLIKFSGVGVINLIVDLATYSGLIFLLGIKPYIANIFGCYLAISVSYLLNNLLTFAKKHQKIALNFYKYLNYLFAYAMTLILSTIFIYYTTDIVGVINSKLIASVLFMFLNYAIAHKIIVDKNEDLKNGD